MAELLSCPPDASAVRWHVMRAYKCERKAEAALSSPEGLEHFIPKRRVVRVYHGVSSLRFAPVIPSLVFVRASRLQLLDFKKRFRPLQFVMWDKSTGPEYLTVPDVQMSDFIRVATAYEADVSFCLPDELSLRKGVRVRIHGGRFDGVSGVFMRVKGKRSRRLVVLLDGVLAVAAEVSPDLVEVLG